MIVVLSGVVGMEPLTQSHVELEKECHLIVDEAMMARALARQVAGV
jgi:hypothetical protein